MSKGSKRRPRMVPDEEFDANWDRCFGGLRQSGNTRTKPRRARVPDQYDSLLREEGAD